VAAFGKDKALAVVSARAISFFADTQWRISGPKASGRSLKRWMKKASAQGNA
jgi:hypothetical protein